MCDEFWVRATLVKERMDRLHAEALRIALTDPDRLAAIEAESNVLLANLEGIREEQLIAMLPQPKPEKKRWWRRGS